MVSWIRPLVVRLGGQGRGASWLVRELIQRHWRIVGCAFLFNLFAAVLEGSTMAILTLALETLAGEGEGSAGAAYGPLQALTVGSGVRLGRSGLFLLLIGLAVGSQLLRSGLQFAGRAATACLQARVESDVRGCIFRQFMAMSYAEVTRYKIGDLTSFVEQARYTVRFIGNINTLLSELLIIASYTVMLFWLSWPMTLVALLSLTLLSFLLRRVIGYVRQTARAFIAASVKLSERTVEFLQGFRLVRTFAREGHAIESVDAVLLQSMVARRKGLTWEATIIPIVESLTVIGVAAFLIGGYVFLEDATRSSLPRLAVFLLILYRLMPRIGSINNSLAIINRFLPAIDRISSILRTDDKEYMVDGDRSFTGLRDGIEFRNVSLSYDKGEDGAVENLSFMIPRGCMVALVGESGAGKSTVVDLLLRLYDPTVGQILVDSVDLRELDSRAWRNHIGVVSQDTFVFNASVRDNIAFGRPEATEDEIIAAAEVASAHEFITELREGYDTVVGDRGCRLSGGQRQRIAIARAVLRQAPILVLDEATSELDSHAERQIQKALDNLRTDRTVIAVAHRLSTILMADQILVLEDGKLVEKGRHTELLALNGRYARIWRIQSESEHEAEPAGLMSTLDNVRRHTGI